MTPPYSRDPGPPMKGLTYFNWREKRASINEGAGPANFHIDLKHPYIYLAIQLGEKFFRVWARTWGPRPRVGVEIA